MSQYFSITPMGIGTDQIECLSSYLSRMADAHGVTRYQLVSHLRAWWKQRRGKTLPRCEELAWNGYGPNVHIALQTLRDATGQDLTDCTLSRLKGTCSGNCISSIRHTRYWCPVCYQEDVRSDLPVYDRLVWQLQISERCSIHKHRLLNKCPSCGELQRNDISMTGLDRCYRCMRDLSTGASKRFYMPNPAFGEKNAHSLVACLPNLKKIPKHPHVAFIKEMERGGIDRCDLAEPLGEIFHERRTIARPQLGSLFLLAEYFDVDMSLLLTNPRMTAKQCDLGFRLTLPPSVHRKIPRTREERRAAIESALRRTVQGPAPYPSFAEFSREHGMHEQTIFRHFPELSRDLISKRDRSLGKFRAAEVRRVEVSLKKFLDRGEINLSKEAIRSTALSCRSSICQVRKAWKRLRATSQRQ